MAGAGIEVLWPADLFAGELRAQATIKTAAPPGGVPAGFSLDLLLQFEWQPTLDGEVLTPPRSSGWQKQSDRWYDCAGVGCASTASW